MKIQNSQDSLEIDIPEGWEPIEQGSMQAGDRFLIGGRHNAILMQKIRWSDPITEGSISVMSPITPETLIIRGVK